MSRARDKRAGEMRVPARDGLPAHTLRISDRAHHVRLTVSPQQGLVVVVPRRMRHYDVTSFLRARHDWIERTSARFAQRRALFCAGPDALLPDVVAFPATGERWHVEYRATLAGQSNSAAGSSLRARLAGGALVVSGAVDDGEACLAALQRWLQRAARERLLPILAEESAKTGIRYESAAVRGQRSRWGSCSHAGTISLNRCLLFLPPELARSVIVHELAHRTHPNHSAAFWRHLETLDPFARRHRTAMHDAWDSVPVWAEVDPRGCAQPRT